MLPGLTDYNSKKQTNKNQNKTKKLTSTITTTTKTVEKRDAGSLSVIRANIQ